MGHVLAAAAVWVAILAVIFHRSSGPYKVKGLLLTAVWLGITAPIAYARLGNDLGRTAWSAIAGGVLFALLARGRFDTIFARDRNVGESEDHQKYRLELADLWVLLPFVALSVIVFWP